MNTLKTAAALLLIMMISSCGPTPQANDKTAESPGLPVAEVGHVYDMTLATDPVSGQMIKTNVGEMNIKIADATTLGGTFNCYANGHYIDTLRYSIKVKWDADLTLYTGAILTEPLRNDCVSNRYFGFKNAMKFNFGNNQLTITDSARTQTYVFDLRTTK